MEVNADHGAIQWEGSCDYTEEVKPDCAQFLSVFTVKLCGYLVISMASVKMRQPNSIETQHSIDFDQTETLANVHAYRPHCCTLY
jgi:hypothetical protein